MPIPYQTRHTQFTNHAKHTYHSIIYMFLIIPFISKPILIVQEQPIIQTAHGLAQSLAQG